MLEVRVGAGPRGLGFRVRGFLGFRARVQLFCFRGSRVFRVLGLYFLKVFRVY